EETRKNIVQVHVSFPAPDPLPTIRERSENDPKKILLLRDFSVDCPINYQKLAAEILDEYPNLPQTVTIEASDGIAHTINPRRLLHRLVRHGTSGAGAHEYSVDRSFDPKGEIRLKITRRVVDRIIALSIQEAEMGETPPDHVRILADEGFQDINQQQVLRQLFEVTLRNLSSPCTAPYRVGRELGSIVNWVFEGCKAYLDDAGLSYHFKSAQGKMSYVVPEEFLETIVVARQDINLLLMYEIVPEDVCRLAKKYGIEISPEPDKERVVA
ncbi:hypothetical protein KKD61_01890, partial [Patescibacteria group bacterium]|nr:hypothetical protein [Patescibacteria group bacterium]